MPARRLDDRIRELCALVTAASKSKASGDEIDTILQELLSAVHEKIDRLRHLAAKQMIGRQFSVERRLTPPHDGNFRPSS